MRCRNPCLDAWGGSAAPPSMFFNVDSEEFSEKYIWKEWAIFIEVTR
jgi:hypothetical protein